MAPQTDSDMPKQSKRINAFGIVVLIVIIVPLLVAAFLPERSMTKEEFLTAGTYRECIELHKLTNMYRLEKANGVLPDDFELGMLMFGNTPYVVESRQLRDSWGNPFQFQRSGPEPTDFSIYSSGPDGTLKTDDDITSGELDYDIPTS